MLNFIKVTEVLKCLHICREEREEIIYRVQYFRADTVLSMSPNEALGTVSLTVSLGRTNTQVEVTETVEEILKKMGAESV